MEKAVHVAVALGTRPEAVKLAPVVHELRDRGDLFRLTVISTAQHRQMLDQVLALFAIEPDLDLAVMRPDQGLAGLTSRALLGMEQALAEVRPDVLVVQGDTTTVFAASLAAFYARVPVAHVEAGLRSRDLANPYPEEANRRLAGVLSSLHFAPTKGARDNLLAEGVDPARTAVTGNTVVDALRLLDASGRAADASLPFDETLLSGRTPILVTTHRRESFGREMENVFLALRDIATARPDTLIVYPVHLNPNVHGPAHAILGDVPGVVLCDPLDYGAFVRLMRQSRLILTDSGGVQEEAPTFGRPVLVLRSVTERPEASRQGLALLVGTDRARIVRETLRLLDDEAAYLAMSTAGNPYGDGLAARRIATGLARFATGATPLLDTHDEFDSGPPHDA